MLRRALRSTLVPYTPLFRSQTHDLGAEPGDTGGDDPRQGRDAELAGVAGFHDHQGGGAVGQRAAVDRKSTRLNSSHVAISYAVFCLKKKMPLCVLRAVACRG